MLFLPSPLSDSDYCLDWKRPGESVNHDIRSGGVDVGIQRCRDFHGTVGFALGAKEDTPASEKKLNKVTLKLKGVSQTTQSSVKCVDVSDGSCPKPSHTSDASHHLQHELHIQVLRNFLILY